MFLFRSRYACALLLLLGATSFSSAVEQTPGVINGVLNKISRFPFPEKLTYHVEWRLVTAGIVTVQLSRATGANWEMDMEVQSAGLVTHLYRVIDKYKVVTNQKFCGVSSNLDAQEGKRHKQTALIFDPQHNKVEYDDHDALKNTSEKKLIDVPPCTHEIAGALASLRLADFEPGKWASIPITDGKKFAYGKIEAQAKETINLNGRNYQTVRCEAFLFDNVLYRRKGRLFIWMTDDAAHVPVQLRFQLGFPIGTVTVELDKQQQF